MSTNVCPKPRFIRMTFAQIIGHAQSARNPCYNLWIKWTFGNQETEWIPTHDRRCSMHAKNVASLYSM